MKPTHSKKTWQKPTMMLLSSDRVSGGPVNAYNEKTVAVNPSIAPYGTHMYNFPTKGGHFQAIPAAYVVNYEAS